MKAKRFSKKIKLLAMSLALIMVAGVSAVVVLALQKTNLKSGFEISVIGGRHVEATIDASAHISSDPDPVQELSQVKFDKDSTKDKESVDLNFTTTGDNKIELADFSDVVSYRFKITNTATTDSYSDLIIEPAKTITLDNENVVGTLYYSSDGSNYEVITDKYLVVEKGDTLYVELQIRVSEKALEGDDFSYGGQLAINLYSERGAIPEDYEPTYEYSLSADKTKAYRTKVYSNGDKAETSETLKRGQFVVATPETAQEILDSEINGKVVIFTEGENGGEYGVLQIRPSKNANLVINECDATDANQKGAEITVSDLDLTQGDYHYTRTLENVVFTATEGVVFNKIFVLESTYINNDQAPSLVQLGISDSATRTDPIREVECDSRTGDGDPELGYYAHIPVKNVKILNMNFKTSQGRIAFIHSTSESFVDGLLIQGCSFENTDIDPETSDYLRVPYADAGITIRTELPQGRRVLGHQKNVVIKDNSVKNFYQGIVLYSYIDAVIANNTIDNTEHNSISAQCNKVLPNEGTILIVNNTMSNALERAVRLGFGIACNTIVENNTMIDTKDKDDEILKSQGYSENSTLSFANNTYNGTLLGVVKSNGVVSNHIISTIGDYSYTL